MQIPNNVSIIFPIKPNKFIIAYLSFNFLISVNLSPNSDTYFIIRYIIL